MTRARNDRLAGWRVTVRKTIARPPEAVFALLTDVERMAGLGPEHYRARWVCESREAGARFVGSNRIGDLTWDVICTVTEYVRPERFSWTVDDPREPSSTWTYTLEPDGGGTDAGTNDGTIVTQTFAHGPGDSFVRRAVERVPIAAKVIIAGRARQLRANMSATLDQVEAVLMAPSNL